MDFDKSKSFSEYINHHTLLYGETNTKKTYYTAMFVKFLVDSNFNPLDITVLDFAPKIITINDMKIGGKIQDFYEKSTACKNLNFEGDIIPPRLSSTNLKELNENALRNFHKTHQILEQYAQNPTPVLIINDISIYLHYGNIEYLLDIIKKARTFFGTVYYGTSMNRDFSYEFSLKEKKLVEDLVEKIEISYSTD